MKFKLNENLGKSLKQVFLEAGHDVETVVDQGLGGCTDPELFDRCSDEGRCLVSFDLDFADVLRFPPRRTSGVIVIRLPRKPDRELLRGLIVNVPTRVAENPVESRLWIVEPGRIRIHQTKDE